jgi:hypothetical protein
MNPYGSSMVPVREHNQSTEISRALQNRFENICSPLVLSS